MTKTIRKTVALLSAVAMCGSMMLKVPGDTNNLTLELPVFAAEGDAEAEADETYGEEKIYDDYLYYKTVDKENDGTYDYVQITDCDDEASEAIIPAEIEGLPVTSIGNSAFCGCYSLESVTIPSSVTNIEGDAFASCLSLTNIHIPDRVTSIGNHAFDDCPYLESVTISDSVTTIGDYAFYCCTSLESVSIGSGVTSIGNSAFSDCTSLAYITIPDSVTLIGDAAFYGCNSITIKCYTDSFAHIYAINEGISFELLDDYTHSDTTTETTETTTAESATETTETTTTTAEPTTETTETTTTTAEPTTETTETTTSTTESTTTTTETTTTTDTEGELPQTGYSDIYKVIAGLAALMTVGGAALVVKSRKENE